MGDHATNCSIKDFRGSTVVKGPRLFGIHNVTLVEEVVVPELKAKALN